MRKLFTLRFLLLLLIAGAGFTKTNAQVSHLVISQVYGGGGNSGATYKNDFIEIFNPTASAVNLSGWSVQYSSAAGTGTWAATSLSGNILAGGYYLVQEAAGTGGTTSLPTPDATGTIALSATTGKVALVNNNTPLSGACPTAGGTI
ncbi:MAG: lamin tail domain-containing protein, partial [Ferruginibacter sp.]